MAINNYTGVYGYQDDSTPHDLAMMRRHVWEYMYSFGQPVIHRRIYNQDDVVLGSASWDATYDDVYEQGLSWSGSDKGVGAGFGPPSLIYITLGDVVIDDNTPNRTGAFKIFQPNMSAPWVPQISDGDLIIQVVVEYEQDGSVTITGTGDRFQVQQVQPVTLRSIQASRTAYGGYADTQPNYIENLDVIVCQNMQAVRLPRTNPIYAVPLDSVDS